jgi:hypothetical protein
MERRRIDGQVSAFYPPPLLLLLLSRVGIFRQLNN